MKNEHKRQNYHRYAAVILAIISTCILLSSCGVIHQVFSKKVEVTFYANGGVITGGDVKADKDEGSLTKYTHKCIVGDALPDIKAKKKYYTFKGWYTEEEDGQKIAAADENTAVLYAHYTSANKNRTVSITEISKSGESASQSKDIKVRISKDEPDNDIKIRFKLSSYYGQKVAFTDKNGETIQDIQVQSDGSGDTSDSDDDSEDGNLFAPDGIEVTAELPDHKWMDKKATAYYIRSFGNDHVDEGEPVKFRVVLDGQYEYFDEPIEGSTVWYGGTEEAPQDRAGVIVATDKDFVYVKHESTNETEDGSKIYKWNKDDVMINMADVRTDIVYDIYNAYNSRFFPIRGKAMYMDNGQKGLKRYESRSKESAMHKNEKTGKTTFMVPVHWAFAEKVALAESRARDAGYTLYIVDSFRPMNSVDPVAKVVKNASLLTYGGTSAHNFGTAVDTGWQRVDKDGNPVGDPYVKNLQVLKKKQAVKGPNGNEREIWWQGVNKLPQEWWHYGDTTLPAKYKDHAKRVGSLYVNLNECMSKKRSKM